MKSSKKPIQLTPALLKSIIEEEVSKGFGDEEDVEKRAKDTDEVEADEYADSLEHPVDFKKANGIKEAGTLDQHIGYMKALKIEEGRLTKRLSRVREALQKGVNKLIAAKIV